MMVADKPSYDEAEMVDGRIAQLKRKGVRAEFAFEHGTDLNRPPIFYVPDRLVTTNEHAEFVQRLLEGWFGSCGDPEILLSYDNELVVFTVEGDSLHLATAITQAAAKLHGRRVQIPVSPLHVFTPAPGPKIGPGDDPSPASQGDKAGSGPKQTVDTPVAVVDTGLWMKPPHSLSARLSSPTAEEPVDVDPVDGFVDHYGTGHGGFIAGVIDSNAPGTDVVAYNAFGPNGLTEETVINQIDAALLENDVVVVNVSLGSYEKSEGRDRIRLVALRAAMRRWRTQFPGALIVAAAGNDSVASRFFPAGFAGEDEFAEMVVSVGALSQPAKEPGIHASATDFTNYGPWVTAWAPGEKIVSAYPDDLKFGYVDATGNMTGSATFSAGLAYWSGTSFAAPFVAAEIIREMQKDESPRDTWKRIRGASPFVIFWPSW